MTPAACGGGAGSSMRHLFFVAEQFLHLMPPLLQPAQRQGEIRHAVADDVVGIVPAERDRQGPAWTVAVRPCTASSACSWARPSSTSTARTWLIWVKLVIVSARSSRPASIATRL